MSKEILYLINECNNNLSKSYSPYSHFPVSAIVLDTLGNKYYGVNIENASYGLSVCAERNAIAMAVYNGVRTISKIIITANTDFPISPCGMCRQVIKEFADDNTEIILGCNKNKEYKTFNINEILPYGFDNKSL